jgi:hypothetical protein
MARQYVPNAAFVITLCRGANTVSTGDSLASRLFEEIDRLGIGDEGVASWLSSQAIYDFYRAVPSVDCGATLGRR